MGTEEQLEKMKEEWREKILKSYWVIVALSFCMEIVIIFVRVLFGRLESGQISVAVLKTVILPTAANVCLTGWVRGDNKSLKPENEKNRSILIGAMGLSFILATFHGYVFWVLCVYVFPMIISIIFADKKLTWHVVIASIPVMYLSIIFSWILDPNFRLLEHLLGGILNASFLLAVYFVCINVIDFVNQKNEMIEDFGKNTEDLSHALTLDAMTSLYNHAEFNRVLEQKRLECCKTNQYMTLVVADIDHFKRVNDTYGHEQGDKVLLAVADQLLHFCSNKGQVFRYGGEEFAVLLMNQNVPETLDIMEQLRDSISVTEFDFMKPGERVTISIGIYKYGGERNLSTHDIFTRADSAMYEAKNSGRNRCCVYEEKKD